MAEGIPSVAARTFRIMVVLGGLFSPAEMVLWRN